MYVNKKMKKIWFKRKLYGYGLAPSTWQGWLVILLYFVGFVYVFRNIDTYSHSGSDTLIGVVVPVFALTGILIIISIMTGEKMRWQWGKRIEDLSDVLMRGGIAVMPTDTTYGIVGSALNEKTVNEIYRLRKRDLDKPLIVLIADRKDLKKFGVVPTKAQKKILAKVWPGPTSVILPCVSDRFAYLHRGKNTIAFRLPQKVSLRSLLGQTGPLVAPSANPQSFTVARTIAEARAYFGHHIAFYEDGGAVSAPPSHLIDITSGTEKVLR